MGYKLNRIHSMSGRESFLGKSLVTIITSVVAKVDLPHTLLLLLLLLFLSMGQLDNNEESRDDGVIIIIIICTFCLYITAAFIIKYAHII